MQNIEPYSGPGELEPSFLTNCLGDLCACLSLRSTVIGLDRALIRWKTQPLYFITEATEKNRNLVTCMKLMI